MNPPRTGWISNSILSDREGERGFICLPLARFLVGVRGFMTGRLWEKGSLGYNDGEFVEFNPILVFSDIVWWSFCVLLI